MKEVKEPAERTDKVESSIHFAASALKVVAGLVLASALLSAATVVLSGLTLAKTRETRDQIFRDVIEMQLRFDELKKLMRTKSDNVMDELLHLRDEMNELKDNEKKNGQETRTEIHNVQERMLEDIKEVKRGQTHFVKEFIVEQRKTLEKFLEKQQIKGEYDTKVQTRRIFRQFHVTVSHIKINRNAIKTLRKAMKDERKVIVERSKENRKLARSLHSKTTDTISQYARATLQEFKLRANADNIVFHTEMKSLHRSLYDAVQGAKRNLLQAIQREILAGRETTESVVKYAWKGLGSSIRVQGETSRNLIKSGHKLMKTYSKITENMLTGQNAVLKGYMREYTHDVEVHLKVQDRSAEAHFSGVNKAINKHAIDYEDKLKESFQGQTETLSTAISDRSKEVQKYVKVQKDALFAQNLDLLRIISQELTTEHNYFDNKIDEQTTEIKTDINAKKDIIVSHIDAKTVEIKDDILAKKNQITAHVDTKTVEIKADILAKKNQVTSHVDTKTAEVIADILAKKNDVTAHVDTKTAEVVADILAKKNLVTAHIDTKTTEITNDIEAKKTEITGHVDTKTGEITADILAKKNLVTAHMDTKKGEITSHVDTKTGEIIADILAKKNLVTAHMDTKKGEITGHIDTKASEIETHVTTKTGDVTTNVDTKTGEVKTHMDTKKGEITSHIDTKTNEIKTHVTTKTGDVTTNVNAHTDTKKGEITGHVDTKTNEIKTHVTTKTGDVTTSVNANTDTKTGDVTTNVNAKIAEVKTYMDTKKGEITTHVDGETVKISNKIDATYDNTCPVCPQTKLFFPANNQVTDYVKLTTVVPAVTAMTVCAWVTPLTGTHLKGSLFSYATQSQDNSFLLDFWTSQSLKKEINVMVEGVKASLEHTISARTHVCVVVTLASNNAKLYLNGAVAHTFTGFSANTVPGGGTMIVGQDQDSVEGDFETAQGLGGTVENLMVWFSEVSAEDVAAMHSEACFCARNFDASPAINTAEMYGNVAKQKPTEC